MIRLDVIFTRTVVDLSVTGLCVSSLPVIVCMLKQTLLN